METHKIQFVANRPWLTPESTSCPKPIIKTIPEWYRKADRFAVNPHTGEYWKSPQDGGRIPTWKACPSLFDIMGTGYTLLTPCDLEFYYDQQGVIDVKISDPMYEMFASRRPPMDQFQHPMGYDEHHFAWWADWGLATPDGYSVLYTNPFNRYELPFITTNGIIDTDKENLSGMIPFFLVKGWTGILPAGTPYAQIIPFKRENWESEVVIPDYPSMYAANEENIKKYRVPDGGVYKNQVQVRRTYS